jgi:hypothetical protein
MSTSSRISLVGCITLCVIILSCGGGSMGNGGGNGGSTIGPTAILNGSSISGVNSHWVGSNCPIQLELASNHQLRFAVSDTSGTTSSADSTWSPNGTDSATVNFGGTGLGGSFWVTSIDGIHGSTSSRVFTSSVTVASSNGPQVLGGCSFGLQSGKMSF